MNRKQIFLKLFTTTFQLSAFTFGGGYVIIPLMRRKFVQGLGWIDDKEMLDLIAIAQSSPGAIAVNASILVGYHVAGVPGALVTMVGTVLPPLIILSVISLFYQAFRDNVFVSMAMAGMLAGVAAVICDVVINLIRSILRQKKVLPVVVMGLSFVAARYLKVNVALIILVCGILGGITSIRASKKQKEAKK